MKKYLIFSFTLFLNYVYPEGVGLIERSGVGLYIDASYAPVWRSRYADDNVIRDIDSMWYSILSSGQEIESSSVVNSTGTVTTGVVSTIGIVETSGHSTVGYWGSPVFSMVDIKQHFSNGLRVNADFSANRETSVQANFIGLYQFDFDKKFSSVFDEMAISISPYIYNLLGHNIQKVNFEGLSTIDLGYIESFNSIEVNALNHSSPRYYDYFSVAFVRGIRGMEYKNKLSLYAISKEIKGLIPAVYNDIFVRNRNRFIGAQVGLIGMYRISKRLYMSVPIKGGIYADLIQSLITINYRELVDGQIPPTSSEILADLKRNEVGFGVCAETAPRIEVHLGQMYFYVGGSFLYLFGTSPAAKQITDNNTGVYHTTGSEIGSTGVFQKYFFANLPNNMINKPVDSGYFYLSGVTIGGGIHF